MSELTDAQIIRAWGLGDLDPEEQEQVVQAVRDRPLMVRLTKMTTPQEDDE